MGKKEHSKRVKEEIRVKTPHCHRQPPLSFKTPQCTPLTGKRYSGETEHMSMPCSLVRLKMSTECRDVWWRPLKIGCCEGCLDKLMIKKCVCVWVHTRWQKVILLPLRCSCASLFPHYILFNTHCALRIEAQMQFQSNTSVKELTIHSKW